MKSVIGRKDNSNYHYRRDYLLQRKYKISLKEYNRVFKNQEGKCLICSEPPKPGSLLVVDHDHKTGIVRGLLCYRCNTAIGLLGDDSELVIKAAQYLIRNES